MTSLMVIQYSALKWANCCLFRPYYLVEPSSVSNRAATCLGIESHRFLRMFLLFPKLARPWRILVLSSSLFLQEEAWRLPISGTLGLHVILEHVQGGNLGAVGAMKVLLVIIVPELRVDNTAGTGLSSGHCNSPGDLLTE